MSDVKIPEDVMKAAQAAAKEAAMRSLKTGELNPELVIARAILAERERCAKIAAGMFDLRDGNQARVASHKIAQAIRSSHE